MSDKYKVTIHGPGIDVDKDVSEERANQLLLALLSGKTPTIEGVRQAVPETDIEADSLAGYLTASGALTGPAKITAIGAFLKQKRATASFSTETLESSFEDAAEAVPKNIPRDLKKAVRAGWVARKPGEKGSYYVTGAGLKAVSSKFASSAKTARAR